MREGKGRGGERVEGEEKWWKGYKGMVKNRGSKL